MSKRRKERLPPGLPEGVDRSAIAKAKKMVDDAMKRDPDLELMDQKIDGAWFRRGEMRIIVSVQREQDGKLWAHLSASYKKVLPSWGDMKRVRRWILGDDVAAIMVMPAKSDHVNIHPYTHHLWACLEGDPLPDFTHGGGSI